jgi:hypothetical protein
MKYVLTGLRVVAACSLLLAVPINGNAAPEPKYLEIKDFKKCLSTEDMGSYQSWCMPAKKPASCPAKSWTQLSELIETEKLPACQAKAK